MGLTQILGSCQRSLPPSPAGKSDRAGLLCVNAHIRLGLSSWPLVESAEIAEQLELAALATAGGFSFSGERSSRAAVRFGGPRAAQGCDQLHWLRGRA
jgi:hypothetical protein